MNRVVVLYGVNLVGETTPLNDHWIKWLGAARITHDNPVGLLDHSLVRTGNISCSPTLRCFTWVSKDEGIVPYCTFQPASAFHNFTRMANYFKFHWMKPLVLLVWTFRKWRTRTSQPLQLARSASLILEIWWKLLFNKNKTMWYLTPQKRGWKYGWLTHGHKLINYVQKKLPEILWTVPAGEGLGGSKLVSRRLDPLDESSTLCCLSAMFVVYLGEKLGVYNH